METKYTYKWQDITTDMMFKIEHIANILAERDKKDFDATLSEFLASKTYRILQQTNTLLWAESGEFIVDEYDREKQTVH
jgi:cytochrome c biogenesis protein ResB